MKRVRLAFTFLILIIHTSCSQEESLFYSSFEVYSYIQNQINIIEWNSSEEINTSYYVIEKQIDVNTYETIGTVKASGTPSTFKQYYFEDFTTATALPYPYRLTLVHMDGTRVSWLVNQNITLKK